MSALFPKLLARRREDRRYNSCGPPVSPLIGHWSASVGTVASLTNRVTSTVGPWVQATSADQPELVTLPAGGVKVLRFDGAASEMTLAPNAELKATGPKRYWAFHVRCLTNVNGTIYSEWSTGGSSTAERFMLATETGPDRLAVYVAINAIGYASSTFAVPFSVQQAGFCAEVLFNGLEPVAANRVRLYVDGVEVARLGGSGTMPTALQGGDASAFWLGAQNGASNKQMDLAHVYIAKGDPGPVDRAQIRAFEAPTWGLVQETIPALTSWFRNSTVGLISSFPDVLDPANPMTQAGATRPTGNADGSITFGGAHGFTCNFSARNNNAAYWGFGTHVKSLVAETDALLVMATFSGASVARFRCQLLPTGVVSTDSYTTGAASSLSASVVASTARYISVEYNAAAAAGQRLKVFVGTPTSMLDRSSSDTTPAALTTPTGSFKFGMADAFGSGGLNGITGKHLYFYGPPMAGAVSGLLTPAVRRILAAIDQLT